MAKTKIALLYERLSRDDELSGESFSIQNQKIMLEDFARRNGYLRFKHFTDDGVSGTRFDRPGFMAMMEEVEGGNVEAIIVKDMSRMGRDYVYFNFVGKYIPPAFRDVKLTPEEQEALRKKEELKDRRHQAYLRRKASGWQRQYEERTKAAKKAKIDAKKAAIRQEDIERGVFSYVADLPRKEPRKATMQVRPTL